MNCNGLREFLPDLASGSRPVSAETERHLRECPECSNSFESLRQTMALLDEWQAPEPSPYFDTRLRARLREEAEAKHPSRWLAWVRRPAIAASVATMLVVGAAVYRLELDKRARTTPGPVAAVVPGTAVSDLQALDNNQDVYADSDLMDDLQVQDDVNANP